MNALTLGDSVRDTVSGFVGQVVARTDYLHGGRRFGVQAAGLHEGKPIEAQWFEETQLEPFEVGQTAS